jgi:DNA-binding MarR family transcriptional regulator
MENITFEEVMIAFNRFRKTMEQFHCDLPKDLEITHAQGRIIFPIVRHERGFTIKELSQFGGVDKALVSRTITDLETKGIVFRDGHNILLSKKGHEISESVKKNVHEHFKIWAGAHNDDLKTLIDILNKLAEGK